MADLFAYLDGFGTGGSLTKSVIIATAPDGATVTATGYIKNVLSGVQGKCTTAQYAGLFGSVVIPDILSGTNVTLVAKISAKSATRCYLLENRGFSTERKFFDLQSGENLIILPCVVDSNLAKTGEAFFYKATNDGVELCGLDFRVCLRSFEKTTNLKNGEWRFNNLDMGLWFVKAEMSGQNPDTAEVDIKEFGVYRIKLSFANVYGAMRDVASQSPEWTREDAAKGLNATASVGTVPGNSDFSNVYPWNAIKRETLPTGDVVVKIPKFWFARYVDNGTEHAKIADNKTAGLPIHPAFFRNGREIDAIYIASYKTSGGNKSVSGASPDVNKTRAAMRASAREKGPGWSLLDGSALSAVQMLMAVEFASNNVQAKIGRGNCDTSAKLNTGSCDNVPGLTGRPAGTDGKTDVVWRGIEGFWGNLWEFVDGINVNNGVYYVCNDPDLYADDTSEGYARLSYSGNPDWSSSYITEMGVDDGDNNHIMLPKSAGSGSGSTYYCDAAWCAAGWTTCLHGGYWINGDLCGLFACNVDPKSSGSAANTGGRLMYIPQEV